MKKQKSNDWFHTQQQKIDQNPRDPKIAVCECGCDWFEQVVVHQYPKHHTVILGQEVPKHRDIGYVLLRCVKCGEFIEPNIQIGIADSMRKDYDRFLDLMEEDDLGTPSGEKI